MVNPETARAVGLLDYTLQSLDALVVNFPDEIDPAEIAAIDTTKNVIVRLINNFIEGS